ncbi:hypothetical protein TetV_285 [Tetraselmis virus 1]|uniref:Uncharacterized protein n=1 Tax=Tetraselmis virus 1 TaxID=2060617 RepID=A0A2P0VN87_9VIRU|nr:hypothetical protein QJ968_gp285 [Tetraselmis virus 1]AUF82377.1 hypothetical protein TetV_285 [Tetraselmis virus 1]
MNRLVFVVVFVIVTCRVSARDLKQNSVSANFANTYNNAKNSEINHDFVVNMPNANKANNKPQAKTPSPKPFVPKDKVDRMCAFDEQNLTRMVYNHIGQGQKGRFKIHMNDDYEIMLALKVTLMDNRNNGYYSIRGPGIYERRVPVTKGGSKTSIACGHFAYDGRGEYEYNLDIDDASAIVYYYVRPRASAMSHPTPLNIDLNVSDELTIIGSDVSVVTNSYINAINDNGNVKINIVLDTAAQGNDNSVDKMTDILLG